MAAVRRQMPSPDLSKAEFTTRFLDVFKDPLYRPLGGELNHLSELAWEAYGASRKSPITRRAGKGFKDPSYHLSKDWIDAKRAIQKAKTQYASSAGPRRVLIINGSPRTEHSCPGESSKSWRLVKIAERELSRHRIGSQILDLSRVTSEYGRQIHPCKACYSTAAPLCHWPCSCYPNYGLGQVHDWMNEIYPMWVSASGVLIITPVHWYQATSPLKLMIDRLVCADGGNPDPTSTQGKDAATAKKMEMAGWDYPRHLAGRYFGVIVHGDTEGAENLRRSLSDWLKSIGLVSAGPHAELDRYIGYWQPYATSHEELDHDKALQKEVRYASRQLALCVSKSRAISLNAPLVGDEPRKK